MTAPRELALDAVLAEHTPALRNFLGARCRDADLTAELLQEVSARFVVARRRLMSNGNLRGYLLRIAANVWHDHLRRDVVRRRAVDAIARDGEPLAPAADRKVLEQELRDAVRRAIAALPPAERDVVLLRHERGLTFRDIAARLSRPLGTVLSQMHTALRRIGAELEDYR